MEIVLKKTEDAWRSSGRPRSSQVSEEVYAALRSTYNTGEVGVIIIRTPQDLAECRELLAEMRRAAKAMGKRVATQPWKLSTISDRLVYRLVDKDDKQ